MKKNKIDEEAITKISEQMIKVFEENSHYEQELKEKMIENLEKNIKETIRKTIEEYNEEIEEDELLSKKYQSRLDLPEDQWLERPKGITIGEWFDLTYPEIDDTKDEK